MRLPFGIEVTFKKPNMARGNKLIQNLLWPWSFSGQLDTESDYSSFMKAYRGWVYVCASKNAISSASIPLRLYVGKPSSNSIKSHKTRKITKATDNFLRSNPTLSSLPQVRKAAEIEEIVDHPMITLMRNVNSFMNYFSLFELTNLYQELCGNAYWYILEDKLGVPVEIWPMPPQNVKILPDKINFIRGYRFKNGMDEEDFDESKVIHFKFPSPTSLYYGRSPLSAVTEAYNISQKINRYEDFVFGNMGRIEGAFETDNELSQYEFDRLKEEINQTFRGIENVGKSPLLEKGVHYKTYGLAPKDLSFMQGRKAVKEEIVNAYGQSLGLYDKDATRANAEVASFTHMKDTIRPRLIRMEEKLNEKLTPRFDDKLFVAFDDPIPIDKDQKLKEREVNLKMGYSSINMEREADNRESVAWGDIPILNRNLAILGTVVEPSSEPQDTDDDQEEVMSGIDMISERLAKVISSGARDNLNSN